MSFDDDYPIDDPHDPMLAPFFDRQGNPIGLREWGRLRMDEKTCRIDLDVEGEVTISTVWTGFNLGHPNDPPKIFETMVFGGIPDEQGDRYSTEDEAREGHAGWVAQVRAAREKQ